MTQMTDTEKKRKARAEKPQIISILCRFFESSVPYRGWTVERVQGCEQEEIQLKSSTAHVKSFATNEELRVDWNTRRSKEVFKEQRQMRYRWLLPQLNPTPNSPADTKRNRPIYGQVKPGLHQRHNPKDELPLNKP